jgi:hypothetical protein
VKLKATLPANADNPNSVIDAQKKLDAAEDMLRELGFSGVELSSKYTMNIVAKKAETPADA